MLESLSSVFADISLPQLALITAMALVASVVGGVAGYGTGALMPLVLVPIVGAEPVVPILSLSALFTNTSRAAAFWRLVDRRRALIVLVAALPTCVLGAWGYTLLTGKGAALVIGAMLVASVPLRRLMRRRGLALSSRGLAAASLGWGPLAGGTVGAGIILLSLLMAAGLEGAAVVATDAVISIGIGLAKFATFGLAGVVNAQVTAIALFIGAVALPGAFLAKALIERLPLHVHTTILDAVVIGGGVAACSRPLHDRRQRGQERLHIAAGAQPEDGAAVVEQVELHVAAAAHELFLALGRAPGRGEILAHQFGINPPERAAHLLGEGEVRLPVRAVEIVVENAADAAHLAAVAQVEIFIAPALILLIGRDGRMRVASRPHRGVKRDRVGIVLSA